jgi:hypothetical protein
MLNIFLSLMDSDEILRGELEFSFISSFCMWKWWRRTRSHDHRKRLIREFANWTPHSIWSDPLIESICEEHPSRVLEWMNDHDLMSSFRIIFKDDEDEDVCRDWTRQRLVLDALLQFLIVHRDACWRDIVWNEEDSVHPSPIFAAKNHQRLLDAMDAPETLMEMIERHGFLASREFYSSSMSSASSASGNNASFLLRHACKYDEWFEIIREHRSFRSFLGIPLWDDSTIVRWTQWMQRWMAMVSLKGSIEAVLRVVQRVVDETYSEWSTCVDQDDSIQHMKDSVFLLMHPSNSTHIELQRRSVDKLFVLNYIISCLQNIDERVIHPLISAIAPMDLSESDDLQSHHHLLRHLLQHKGKEGSMVECLCPFLILEGLIIRIRSHAFLCSEEDVVNANVLSHIEREYQCHVRTARLQKKKKKTFLGWDVHGVLHGIRDLPLLLSRTYWKTNRSSAKRYVKY